MGYKVLSSPGQRYKVPNTSGDTGYKNKGVFMENLELLRGVVSDETFARIEEETKESKIRLADLSIGNCVSEEF